MSERRACRLAGQHRPAQRHEPVLVDADAALRAALRRISRERPRWGYRRAHALLRADGWVLNIKRTRRIWREEGLRVPCKRQRLGESTILADRQRAQAPDHIWAIASVGSDRRRAQPQAAPRCRRVHPRGAGDRLPAADRRRSDRRRPRAPGRQRGTAPGFVRCDNGPEMTANPLRDWCRFSRAGSVYRAGLAVAEPLRRELRRPYPRRAARRRAVLLPGRSAGPHRGVAHRLQPPPTPQLASDDDPAAFAASLRQPLPEPTATAAGEGVEERCRLPLADGDPKPTSSQPGQQKSPAEEITPAALLANSHSSNGGATTTTTPLSQQVDR
jgi:putative transposase